MNQLVATAIVAGFCAAHLHAVSDFGPSGDPVPSATAVVASHPELKASLERLWRGSPSWRDALRAAARTERQVIVLTPDQVVVQGAAAGDAENPFDDGLLAEVSPVATPEGRVTAVLVVINVPLLEAAHSRRGSLPAEMQNDLDRVVAHEVYGHAVPYLLAGTLAGRCADPLPGQKAADACAIQRENVVRAELGLNRRTDAGINGLTLAYRGRH